MEDSSRIIVEDLPESDVPQIANPPIQPDPIEHLSIANHFNIDIPNKQEDGKLQEVWSYARSLSQRGDAFDIIWQVKHLELSLGAPKLGESRLDRLYRYAKLKRQEGMIQEQLYRV